MAFQYAHPTTALALALLLAACGGGDSNDPVAPEPTPAPLKFELLTGLLDADLDNCQHVNGAVEAARYSRLSRMTAYADALYLVESGERCSDALDASDIVVPVYRGGYIRKLADGRVNDVIQFTPDAVALGYPRVVRYGSGFLRRAQEDGGFVLSYAAARSDQSFALDLAEVAHYTNLGRWTYYVPGLFDINYPVASAKDLVAGSPGQPPAIIDGQGHAASFLAPHDLEADATGLMHVIDDGRIRTIDGDYNVTTLNHAALGIEGRVKALDSANGQVHALAKRAGGQYVWHKLSGEPAVPFEIAHDVNSDVLTNETMAVVGDDLLLSIRQATGGARLYRVKPDGTVHMLSGEQTPAQTQDALDNPAQHLLPPIQHLEYGPDGHLYVVLPQGVLIARDFK